MNTANTLFAGFASDLDPKVVRLMEDGHYFGRDGALAVFEKLHLHDVREQLEFGRADYALAYLNVIYSAMTNAATSESFSRKARVVFLAMKANSLANQIRHHVRLADITSSYLHVIMSVAARSLQILKKLRLNGFLKGVYTSCEVDMMSAFLVIKGRAEEEMFKEKTKAIALNRLWDFTQRVHVFLGPHALMSLMGEGLLHELDREGLYQLKNSLEVRGRIWVYCMEYEYNTDRQRAQTVARLFRSIGEHQKAKEVALRAGIGDQEQKSVKKG